jgi:hypothetical protein
VAFFFPLTGLAVMFWWEVVATGETVGLARGVSAFGALPVG